MVSKIIIGPMCIGKSYMADSLKKKGYSAVTLKTTDFKWEMVERRVIHNKKVKGCRVNPYYPHNVLDKVRELNGSIDYIFIEYTEEVFSLVSSDTTINTANILVVLPRKDSLLEYIGRLYCKMTDVRDPGDLYDTDFISSEVQKMDQMFTTWNQKYNSMYDLVIEKRMNYVVLKPGYFVSDLFNTTAAIDSSNLEETCVFNMLHLNN